MKKILLPLTFMSFLVLPSSIVLSCGTKKVGIDSYISSLEEKELEPIYIEKWSSSNNIIDELNNPAMNAFILKQILESYTEEVNNISLEFLEQNDDLLYSVKFKNKYANGPLNQEYNVNLNLKVYAGMTNLQNIFNEKYLNVKNNGEYVLAELQDVAKEIDGKIQDIIFYNGEVVSFENFLNSQEINTMNLDIEFNFLNQNVLLKTKRTLKPATIDYTLSESCNCDFTSDCEIAIFNALDSAFGLNQGITINYYNFDSASLSFTLKEVNEYFGQETINILKDKI